MRSTVRAVTVVAVAVFVIALSGVVPSRVTAGAIVSAQAPKAMLAVIGGTLVDGHGGPPVDQAVVLVTGNRITAIGARDSLAVPRGATVVDAGGMTIMPGLIDGHVHLDILGHIDYDHWHKVYGPRYEEVITIASRIAIMSGITTVIDMWAPPEPLLAVRRRIERGEIPGPRIFASLGAILHSSAVPSTGRETYAWKASTPDEARAAAEKMIAQGSEVINLMDGLTAEQVRAVADVARPKRVKVTGIAASPADLVARVRAGQQALDHMTGLNERGSTLLDPAVVKAMQETRASVVGTLFGGVRQIRALSSLDFYVNNRRMALLMPPAMWADISASLKHPQRLPRYGQGVRYADATDQAARFKQLWQAGIGVRVGTDAGAMYTLPTETIWEEMDLMVEYAVPPQEVIAAATRKNAEWLNRLDQFGTITEGKLADIIVVDGNPLVSMRDLRHVAVVIKDGKVVKGPSAAPPAGSAQ